MSTNGVTLLGSFVSPYVNRVKIALNSKSVAFDYLEERLSSKSKLLLISNPVYKKVPVLIHEDKIICESLIIIDYIDQAWENNGYSILPSDPYDRSVAQFWAAFVDAKLVVTLKDLLAAQGENKIAVKERLEEVTAVLEEAFVKCSQGKPYFGGNNIGYIDIALGGCLQWIKTVEEITQVKLVDEAKTPKLFGWADRFMSHGAVTNVFPDAGRYLKVIMKMQARLRATSNNGLLGSNL